MPGCCLGAVLLFFGPRVLLFLTWLLTNWYVAFESWIVALLGFCFLPWTSLAWMFVFFRHHGDISGGYVLVLALGVVMDFSAYGGSQVARQRRYNE